MLRKTLLFCIVVSVVLGLGACSGGGHKSRKSNQAEAKITVINEYPVLSGFVIDPAVAAALVCIDIDGDLDCNNDEDSVDTDAIGQFELSIDLANVDSRKIAKIIANTSYEVDTGDTFPSNFSFLAGPGDGHITALTTYAEYMVDNGLDRTDANQAIIDAFGLTAGVGGIGRYDPTVNQLGDISNRILAGYIAQTTEVVFAMNSELSEASMFATVLNYVDVNVDSIVELVQIIDASATNGENKDTVVGASLADIVISDVSLICDENDTNCPVPCCDDVTGLTGGNPI